VLAVLPLPVSAAQDTSGVTMTTQILLQGHARVGGWMAIAVDLQNDGPPVVGELQTMGGATAKTRYAVAVDLPTQSSKRYLLHAQAPAFGGKLELALVVDGAKTASSELAVVVHEQSQLVVGIVAERLQDLAGALRLLSDPVDRGLGAAGPAIVPLRPADLPDRVEAWGTLDRLVWQDVDTDLLSTDQRTAMAGWIGTGGRLVVLGGTAGPDILSGLPDDMLPYRPESTIDVPAEALDSLLGVAPDDASDVPGLAGELAVGRALARVGDRVVAAERSIGAGSVAVVGVDPASGWLATAPGTQAMWRRLVPPRSAATSITTTDDGQILSALTQLPALALPPIGALLLLLAGYIVLVGPVNYLILRRLDRREWAWVTIPALIAGFTVGAYGIGAAIRGSDVMLHELAIVRGAADSGQGVGLVYTAVFSPTRGAYQISVPGGALLSAPVAGDFGVGLGASSMDIVQGDPSRIRDLAIGFGTLRSLRAETQAAVPRIQADLRYEGNTVRGTIVNASDIGLDRPALVIGSNVQAWPTLAPGGSVAVELTVVTPPFGRQLSDAVVGPMIFSNVVSDADGSTGRIQTNSIRRVLVDHLTNDPGFGITGRLPADSPVLLGFTDHPVVGIEVSGQQPPTTATTLYHVPLPMRATGRVSYGNDMMRSSIVALDSMAFNRDPANFSIGTGSMTVAYRPLGLDSALAADRLTVTLSQGGELGPVPNDPPVVAPTGPAEPIEPCLTVPCEGLPDDGLPEVEILDRTTGTWMALPHLDGGRVHAVADPSRYVDAEGGSVWMRFQNARPDMIYFAVGVGIEGAVR
jgi:hypothetical protein